MRRAFCAVALLALACLLPRAVRVGLAGDYVDPVGHITAQDEALYSHSALAMAQPRGDWLTPYFMGRFALYKPPLLIWVAAASAKVFGAHPWALRLPVMIVAAMGMAVLFLWAAEEAGLFAGLCAALLLFGNHLFHTLATLCMTDGLLIAFTAAAIYCLYCDPWLASRRALWGFAACAAAAILTKGIAGVFPVAILVLFYLAVRAKERPTFSRVLQAVGLTAALAAPWFLYEFAVHPRWFWTEHFAIEIFGYGAGAPPQTSQENPILFYGLRLAATDPVLLATVAIALPGFVMAVRRRGYAAILLACWLGLTGLATVSWQYRNASYLLAVVPSLALIAATYGPMATRGSSRQMAAILAVGIAIKLFGPQLPWGLNYRADTIQPAADALAWYVKSARPNPLIVVDVVDDLLASVERPVGLRYAIVGAPRATGAYGMPFEEMGIAVTVDEFRRLPELEPRFRQRLREWGLNPVPGRDPIATLITARSVAELDELIRACPGDDFLVPARYRGALNDAGHEVVSTGGAVFFLLSRGL